MEKIEKTLLELFFPEECIFCKKEGFLICPNCENKFPILHQQACPFCEKVFTKGGTLCQDCRKENSYFYQLIAASEYKSTELPKIIHHYKYRFIPNLSQPLGKILVKGLLANQIKTPDIIIPVPLHPYRLRWRGFNQSQLLAEYVSENLLPGITIPVLNDLVLRKKNTPSQMGIRKYQLRQKNMAEVFQINPTLKEDRVEFVRKKKILIIDDVCTTGATIFNLAKTLAGLSPRSISAVVLARQKIS
jgi:ComF family protein